MDTINHHTGQLLELVEMFCVLIGMFQRCHSFQSISKRKLWVFFMTTILWWEGDIIFRVKKRSPWCNGTVNKQCGDQRRRQRVEGSGKTFQRDELPFTLHTTLGAFCWLGECHRWEGRAIEAEVVTGRAKVLRDGRHKANSENEPLWLEDVCWGARQEGNFYMEYVRSP